MSFVHLNLHTEYSLVDGLVRVPALMQAVADAGMPAVAMTDAGNLFGLVKFYREALARGIKPIIGAEVWLRDGDGRESRLTLLCQDRTGFRRLSGLLTRAYQENQHQGRPYLSRRWLDDELSGLIVLSGGREGAIGQLLAAGQQARAQRLLEDWLQRCPDRFYLELTRTGRPGEESYIDAVVDLAATCGAPVVASNDVRFLGADEFEAHEARVCIHMGRLLDDPNRPRTYSDRQYLRSPDEMRELFADLPSAIDNTLEIARRCNLTLELGESHLPDFPIPQGRTPAQHLAAEASAGLESLLVGVDEALYDSYRERLEEELGIIEQMGFPGYFLIVADFIRWAREQGIPVGPGRGSGAGSLVACVLGITRIDPIEHDLLFERFLNPERVSLPDFDIDFCMDGRDRVIDYVAERYGRERVSQIITFGTMAARAVVRDVGRVLGHPYGLVDGIAKLVPFELKMTLDKALDQEPQLRARYDQEDEVRVLIDLARTLEGLARNAGKHAGGVVIAPSDITDFMPLYCEPGGDSPVTQLDKDDAEALGLVKFDFLGLRTLTIIDHTVRTLIEQGAVPDDFSIDDLPLDDGPAYALMRRCETVAIFQLESRGMRDLIRRLRPDCFDDVVALVALYRPGPLQSGMVDDFIARKHGEASVDFLEPRLEPALKPTYGVILYQEQVMQIAQVLGGYSLGGADLLRRAMGKKKPEEMARQRDIFMAGVRENGVDERRGGEIFDLMEKFAGYGFNKSHSAAYALVSYQTAWLKAHHPAAFMAAVLSADMDNTDKVDELVLECRRMGLKVQPPHVNRSEYRFTVADDGSVRYGLGAVKGVGQGAVDMVVATRRLDGAYESLDALCQRVDAKRIGRRAFEALTRAGALDGLGSHRAAIFAGIPDALARAEQRSRDLSTGQVDLFGAAAPAERDPAQAEVPAWSDEEAELYEYESLGFFLTSHPVRRRRRELARLTDCRLDGLARREGQHARVAGVVVDMRVLARDRPLMFATLDDGSERVELKVDARAIDAARERFHKTEPVIVRGKVLRSRSGEGCELTVQEVWTLAEARAAQARELRVELAPVAQPEDLLSQLRLALDPSRGGSLPVRLHCRNGRAVGELRLGDEWRVKPDEDLLRRLRGLAAVRAVTFDYDGRNDPSAPGPT